MPVVFIPHGGGPWPFVDTGFPQADVDDLKQYLRTVASVPPRPPAALLVVSAHWEASVPSVMTSPHPPMLYDYYGFPPESYRITWPAPGHPELARHVEQHLRQAGFHTDEDPARGYDHGTFVPLKVTYPAADIPVVQLSLIQGLDPAQHLALGRALAPLRDEDIFIIGSGMTFHNLRIFRDPRSAPIAETFDGWLRDTMAQDPDTRAEGLTRWSSAPAARLAHPREEHLIPLMVATGAAGSDAARLAYNNTFAGLRLSAFHFGEPAATERAEVTDPQTEQRG
jgi:aromatic ring-opening dioxygenase catalytic subunit (LigB family)